MKIAVVLFLLCLVTSAFAVTSKRFVRLGSITRGFHHVVEQVSNTVHQAGKELDKGVNHLGKELENGVGHLGKELGNGLHQLGKALAKLAGVDARDVACTIYPYVKAKTAVECTSACVGLVVGTLAPFCPAACNIVVSEADKLVDC
ncbi:uncharacterized protein [Littorina saxatilis]